MPSALDRTFELEAVEGDLGQVIAGEHYVVKPYVIPQGEVSGIFPIYLKSTDDFKNSSFKVVFAVREKDGFRGGAREYARLYLIDVYKRQVRRILKWLKIRNIRLRLRRRGWK